eukprot:gb/GEZN01004963.1/.p1 GENE.gb/GEZN01004963.1/~~gb/GEZN01004963.1/.p1  ORF type:complete len:470 (+),score=69.23 gb/GEZN01004963.1/:44-1453(+)
MYLWGKQAQPVYLVASRAVCSPLSLSSSCVFSSLSGTSPGDYARRRHAAYVTPSASIISCSFSSLSSLPSCRFKQQQLFLPLALVPRSERRLFSSRSQDSDDTEQRAQLQKRLLRFAEGRLVPAEAEDFARELANEFATRPHQELDEYLYQTFGQDLASFEAEKLPPPPASPPSSGIWGTVSKVAGGAAVLGSLGKMKGVLAALKLTKFASLGSMVFSSVAYSFVFGLPYAVGMVSLMLIHESGHALAMMHRGIPFGPMVFIPFMGAVVEMKGRPVDCYEEAFVGIAGPILGSVGAAGFALAGLALDSQLLIALGDFGFMINLFNLLPIGQMDGGRVLGALSKWWLVGGLGLGGLAVYSSVLTSPIIYLILMGGGYTTYQRFTNSHGLPASYFALTTTQRATIGLSYVGLVFSLVLAMQLLNPHKKSVSELQGGPRVDYYADDPDGDAQHEQPIVWEWVEEKDDRGKKW